MSDSNLKHAVILARCLIENGVDVFDAVQQASKIYLVTIRSIRSQLECCGV